MKHRPHPKNLSSDDGAAVSSSEGFIPMESSMVSSSQSHRVLSIEKPSVAVEDHSRDAGAAAASTTASESVVVERRADCSVLCKWIIANFPRIKSRTLWSKYFEVGGFDCRLLIYPKGDSQALPGYSPSIYKLWTLATLPPPNGTVLPLKIPRIPQSQRTGIAGTGFRPRRSLMGGAISPLNSLLDPTLGFLHSSNDCILFTADIFILHESFSFSRDNYDLQFNNVWTVGREGIMGQVGGDILSGKFSWRVHNFSLFEDMIKSQKIMSPVFQLESVICGLVFIRVWSMG